MSEKCTVCSGLSSIVECRAMARPTLFLCLNCAEKINAKEFCSHMTSERHQYICIVSTIVFVVLMIKCLNGYMYTLFAFVFCHFQKNQYPEILQEWQCQTSNKLPIRDLAGRVALMEQGSDVKVNWS